MSDIPLNERNIQPPAAPAFTTPPKPISAESKIDFKLVLIMVGVLLTFTLLYIDTFGIIAAGIAYAILKKNSGQREIWIYGIAVMILSLLKDLLQIGLPPGGREVAITILSAFLLGLVAVGVASLCYFIKNKVKRS